MRLILVHSWGPMGSSLVNAILEKFGVLNLPIRDVGLSASVELSNHGEIDTAGIQKGILSYLETLCRPVSLGGVGMLDRDTHNKIVRADKERVRAEVESYSNQKFNSIADAFFEGRMLIARALTYKTVSGEIAAHGELINDSIIYHENPQMLWDGYRRNFPDCKIIHMHREFSGWLNSLASQTMVKNSWRKRIGFQFTHKVRGYKRYAKMADAADGLHLDFSKLFQRPFIELVELIGRFIDLPVPKIDWEAEKYDLFGKILSFETAFSPFDDKREFLSAGAMERLLKLSEGSRFLPLVLWREFEARLIYFQCCRRFLAERAKSTELGSVP